MGGGTQGKTPWLISAYYLTMQGFVRIYMFALLHPTEEAEKMMGWNRETLGNEVGVKEKGQ